METKRLRKLKTSILIFINVLLFMFCWLPLYIIDTINIFNKEFAPDVRIINGFVATRFVRSTINPFLFVYHMKEVKSNLLTCFGCFKCEDDTNTLSSTNVVQSFTHRTK